MTDETSATNRGMDRRALLRNGLLVMALAVALVGLSAPATAAPADGFETPAGTVLTQDMMQDAGLAQAVGYRLAFWHSSKCLEILGASRADGATAGQWDCHGAAHQQWTFEYYPDGVSFRLRNSHSDKCLDLLGASQANGAAFGQWTCTDGLNQRFVMRDSGVGGWIFQVLHSEKCIDVLGASGVNGATVGQYDCTWRTLGANQRIVWI